MPAGDGRTHQIRVHLRQAGLPVAVTRCMARPVVLSRLKPNYRLKHNQTERPLINRVALHAAELKLPHPVTRGVVISAPWRRT